MLTGGVKSIGSRSACVSPSLGQGVNGRSLTQSIFGAHILEMNLNPEATHTHTVSCQTIGKWHGLLRAYPRVTRSDLKQFKS